MVELLLVILLCAIILGAIYWVLLQLGLPYPWPLIVVGVIVILLLLAAIDSGDVNIGNGR